MSDLVKTPERLKQSILQEAMQGKLTKQLPNDGNAEDLIKHIYFNRDKLIKAGKIKNYKAMPINRNDVPFTIPNNWEWTRLGNISDYIQKGKSPDYGKNGILAVSQRCVQWNGIDLSYARTIKKSSLAKYKKIRFLKPYDILWNSLGTGTLGRASILNKNVLNSCDNKLVADSRVMVIRLNNILPDFVLRYIQSNIVQQYLYNVTSGSTNQIVLNQSQAINLKIPVPPLAEQHRIVQRLNEILPKVDDLNKDVVKLDSIRTKFPHRLKQSLLLEAMKGHLTQQLPSDGNADDLLQKIQQKKQHLIQVGKICKHRKLPPIGKDEIPFKIPKNWKWVRFSNLYHFVEGAQPPKAVFMDHKINGYIRLFQVRDYGKYPKPSYIPKNKARKITKEGDILTPRYGGSRGKVFRAHYGAYNVALLKLTPYVTKCLNINFMFVYLKSPFFQLLVNSTGRSAQAGFNKEDLKKLIIPVPPLPEQHRIVSKLHDLFNTINS